MEITSLKTIIRYRNQVRSETTDILVNEIVISLSAGNKELTTLTCSPGHLEELAAGFLVTSGIISAPEELSGLRYDEATQTILLQLSAGILPDDRLFIRRRPVGGATGTLLFAEGRQPVTPIVPVAVSKDKIVSLMEEFTRSSEVFSSTGGVHSAALSDGQSVLVMREDIGRHNAIDKVIGNLFLKQVHLDDKILLTSGRISSEIVLKVFYAGIPMIISKSAPTVSAADLSEKYGITLVGFARGGNFNVYAHPGRVTF